MRLNLGLLMRGGRKGLCWWFGGNPRLLAGGTLSSLQMVTERLGLVSAEPPPHPTPSTQHPPLHRSYRTRRPQHSEHETMCSQTERLAPSPHKHNARREAVPFQIPPNHRNPETPSAQTGSLMQSISRSTSANVPPHASSTRGNIDLSPHLSVKKQSKPTGGN